MWQLKVPHGGFRGRRELFAPSDSPKGLGGIRLIVADTKFKVHK